MITKNELRQALDKSNIAHDILQSKYNDVLEAYTETLMECSTLRKENEMLKHVLKITDIPAADKILPRVNKTAVQWVSILRDYE